MNPSSEPDRPSARPLWIAVGIAFVVLVVVIFAQNRAALQPGAVAHAASPTASSSPAASANDDARRAAVAKLGFIQEPRAGKNAVDIYNQALALYRQLSPEDQQILQKSPKLDPGKKAEIEAEIQPILKLLHDARSADYADWGTMSLTMEGFRHGAEVDGGVKGLAGVAQWDASDRFGSDPAGAVSELSDANALARSDANSDGGFNIDLSIHEKNLQIVAQNFETIAAMGPPNIGDLTDLSWVAQDYHSDVAGSIHLLQNLIDQYNDPARNGEVSKLVENGFSQASGLADTPANMNGIFQWIQNSANQYANNLQDNDSQFQQFLNSIKAAAPSEKLSSNMINSFQEEHNSAEVAEIQNTMLIAAMALANGDQVQLQSIVDPVTGQPFTITENSGGRVINSTFKDSHGDPVALTIKVPVAQ
jgi:hypothetical protein